MENPVKQALDLRIKKELKELQKEIDMLISFSKYKIDPRLLPELTNSAKKEMKIVILKRSNYEHCSTYSVDFMSSFFQQLWCYGVDTRKNIEMIQKKLWSRFIG
jgi:hypothetical protein